MLHYIDCNAAYVNSTDIMDSLMPDGLHPNHVGMALLAQVSHDLIWYTVSRPREPGKVHDHVAAGLLSSQCLPVSLTVSMKFIESI